MSMLKSYYTFYLLTFYQNELMEKDYFKCYELFHKIGKELPSELQAKYYVALMEYGLYWIEPTDPVIKSLLQWPMYSIQKTNEGLKKKSDWWKNHSWNQYTKWDTKWKAQKTSVEDSGTYMEDNGTEWKKEDIEDIEVIEDNKKEINKEKRKYLDFVYLTDEEYKKLLNIFWESKLNQAIENLNNYIWQYPKKWKKYSSHYHTIRKRNQEYIQEMEKRKKENAKQDLPSEWLLWTITLRR